jgi:sugar phosphate isomerase/epimerase
MMTDNSRERFGFAADGHKLVEESITRAAANGFGYLDFQADLPPNDLQSFTPARIKRVRDLCDQTGVALGIHPSSAINSAEIVPIMREAVDQYLLTNLELAGQLGCGWLVGHGGYHFGDLKRRQQAAMDRMRRLLDRAEQLEVPIYFENHNREPEHAEMHYLPHTLAEIQPFFEAIQSPYFKWSFNVAHAHLVPEGWQGFLAGLGADNIGQVRVNDNRGDYEIHLVPGEGTIDFAAFFAELGRLGYQGWFNLGFGDDADKVRIRDQFVTLL